MVEPKELIIGNWVEHNANWCYRSPAEIKPFKFQWEDRDWYAVGECTMDLEDLLPIELTLDILEKGGFSSVVGWADDLLFNKEGNYTVMARFGKFQVAGILYEIKYVHELQNIHYTKTKKELKINL